MTAASPESLPNFQRAEDLDRYARTYGINRESLRAARTSAEARRGVIGQLQQSGLNGQSERMAEHLTKYQQEFDRKESWLRKIPLIGKPLDWTWRQFKKHPVMYTLLGAAAGAALLGWYYGFLGKKLLDYLPNYSAGVNRVGRQAAIPAAEGMPLAGEGVLAVPGGTLPSNLVTPVPTPVPNPLPLSPSPTPLPPGVFAAPVMPTPTPVPTPIPSPAPSPIRPLVPGVDPL